MAPTNLGISGLLCLGLASVGQAQINSFSVSATRVNPGETITISAGYANGTTAFLTTPYAIEADETPAGFSYDPTTLQASFSPANPQAFSISTAGWKPGLYHLTLQASNGDYRDFALKVGMPHSQYRIVEEYAGPVAGGLGSLVQNLLPLPDGSVLGGAYRTPGGPDVGEVWENHPDGVYNTRPLTFGERYTVNGQSTIIGMSSLNEATATPGVFLNKGLRYSYNDGRSSTSDQTATVNVPLARAGQAHGPYEGPLTYRSIVHVPDPAGSGNGTLLATAYANFVGDDALWRWTGPSANSNTQNPATKRTRSILLQSTDNGKTWDYLSTIGHDNTTGMEGYNETVMKRLPDGQLVALMRTGDEAWAGYGPGNGQLGNGWMDNPLMMARSNDGGLTWSTPRRTGVESVSPDMAVLSDGTLVSSYGRPGANLMFSVDGGNSWIDHYSVDPERYRGYTAVAEASPGVLLVTYRALNWLNPETGQRQEVTRVKRLRVSKWGEGILAQDSFDYGAAGNLNGANGGSGFKGKWYADAALTQDVDIEVDGKSLSAPSGYGLAPEAGRLVGRSNSSRSAYRALADESVLDLGVDQDYYASVLVKRAGSAGAGTEDFAFSLLSGTTPEVQFAISSSGVPTIVGLGATTSGSGNIGFGQTFLLAMKISAKATDGDRAYMKLYGEGDVVNLTEPGNWNVTGSTELTNAILDRLGLKWGNNASLIYDIDEVRLARTWEESVILGGRRIRPTGLKIYEPFNYSGNLAGKGGGIGFDGGWHGDAALTQPADVVLAAGSITAPGGYAPYTEGNRIRGTSADTRAAYRRLAAEAQMSLAVDQDYYLTLLTSRSDAGGGGGSSGFSVSLLDGTERVVQAAVSSSGRVNLLDLGDTATSADPLVGFDQPYLLILKIAASASGEDQAFLKVYGPDDIVDFGDPAEWDLVGSGEFSDAIIDRLGLGWGTSPTLVVELDELRIATSWSDAVKIAATLSIPEPGLTGASLLAMVGLLRPRRGFSRKSP